MGFRAPLVVTVRVAIAQQRQLILEAVPGRDGLL